MRHLVSISALISVTFTFALYSVHSYGSSSEVSEKQLYVSKDQHGNKVFSDRQPKLGEYETKQQLQILTVIWVKPKSQTKLKLSNKTKKKRSKTKSNKLLEQHTCQKLFDEMNSLEMQLEYKQKASQFDSVKKRLRKARWQYQTKC